MSQMQSGANPSPSPAPDRWLRANEVAEILAIGVRSVWRLKSNGTLPSVAAGPRTTRFRLSDVRRLQQTGTSGEAR